MDKVVSAGLIAGIIILICVNCVIVFNTWIAPENGPYVIEAESGTREGADYLTFNDDTSIDNNSDNPLWLRARIVFNSRYSEDAYEIISSAADEGYWQKNSDGWYYYIMPLDSGDVSRPLIDKLFYEGKQAGHGATGKFRMHAEAVDDTWLSSSPENAAEAFRLYETECSGQNTGRFL